MPIAYYPSFLRYHLPGTTDLASCILVAHADRSDHGPQVRRGSCGAVGARRDGRRCVVDCARNIDASGRLIYAARDRPMTAFAVFSNRSTAAYLPMHLEFGDTSWLEFRRFRCRSRPAVSCFTWPISLPVPPSAP